MSAAVATNQALRCPSCMADRALQIIDARRKGDDGITLAYAATWLDAIANADQLRELKFCDRHNPPKRRRKR